MSAITIKLTPLQFKLILIVSVFEQNNILDISTHKYFLIFNTRSKTGIINFVDYYCKISISLLLQNNLKIFTLHIWRATHWTSTSNTAGQTDEKRWFCFENRLYTLGTVVERCILNKVEGILENPDHSLHRILTKAATEDEKRILHGLNLSLMIHRLIVAGLRFFVFIQMMKKRDFPYRDWRSSFESGILKGY